MGKEAFFEKYKDPRWQKLRLEILERDEWTCQVCSDRKSTLHVHHRYYLPDTDPWDYPAQAFATLCADCHEDETKMMKEALGLLNHELRRLFFSSEVLAIACSLSHEDHGSFLDDIVAWALVNKKEVWLRHLEDLKLKQKEADL